MRFTFILLFLTLCNVINASDWFEMLLDGNKSINDTICDINTVRKANSQHLHSILEELVNTTYFRLFKVPKDGKCPLDDDIEEEKDPELCEGSPFSFSGRLASNGLFGEFTQESTSSCAVDLEDLDHSITKQEDTALIRAMEEVDLLCDDETSPSFWLNICEPLQTEEEENEKFINLQKNIERYTGYNGTKIWSAIYEMICSSSTESSDLQGDGLCLEERLIYRVISGLHSSISTHISLAYHRKAKLSPKSDSTKQDSSDVQYSPNPTHFIHVVGSHPERVENLFFSFLILLRSLKKADKLLLNTHTFNNLDIHEDIKIKQLISYLLQSAVLTSCNPVFKAFDETLLFKDLENKDSLKLKRLVKEKFMNVSSLFNCVRCQSCKLHGKLELLGIGTALKILFIPESHLDIVQLSREEIIALFNTLYSFSESIQAIPVLVKQYWLQQQQLEEQKEQEQTKYIIREREDDNDLRRLAAEGIGKVIKNVKEKDRNNEDIQKLLNSLVDKKNNEEILILAEYYKASNDHYNFYKALTTRLALSVSSKKTDEYDVIIIGSGLAGLTTGLSLSDEGYNILILEKMNILGGNSLKASSGINAVLNGNYNLFFEDIINSGSVQDDEEERKRVSEEELSDEEKEWRSKVWNLVRESTDGYYFLKDRVEVDLSKKGKLGGHSEPRTYRPEVGYAGSEIVAKLLQKVNNNPLITIRKQAQVVKLLLSQTGSQVKGLIYKDLTSEESERGERGEREEEVFGKAVVIATGGYSYSKSIENKVLSTYRPDLMTHETTNGEQAIGDGYNLLTSLNLSKQPLFIDLDKVQVHPTGFIKDEETEKPKIKLAAEILRGEGAILLNSKGHRVGKKINSHLQSYLKLGYLQKFASITELLQYFNWTEIELHIDNREDKIQGACKVSKTWKMKYKWVDKENEKLLEGLFFVGTVTPVVHYSMGGILTDFEYRVRREGFGDKTVFNNLFAVGEVVGGLHGKNRLGGNGLTECVVSGRRVAAFLHDSDLITPFQSRTEENKGSSDRSGKEEKEKEKEGLCIVQLKEEKYDLTEFMEVHPAGKEVIEELCGKDGTKEFEDVHSYNLLSAYDIVSI